MVKPSIWTGTATSMLRVPESLRLAWHENDGAGVFIRRNVLPPPAGAKSSTSRRPTSTATATSMSSRKDSNGDVGCL